MDDNTTKIIKDKFNSLPESIQEIILSTHYQDTLIEIAKKYQLNIEKLGILERETTLVMMGLTPTKNFEHELTRELSIDEEKGSLIVKDINEEIFLKIRELLKLMNTPAGEEPDLEEETKSKELFLGNPLRAITEENIPHHDTEEQKANNTQVFKDHGIEIVGEGERIPPSPSQARLPDGQGEGLGGVRSVEGNNPIPVPEKLEISTPAKATPQEGNNTIHPILNQKLSGPMQVPVVKTDHSLPNITPPVPPQSKPAIDPYREIPE